MNPSGIAFVIFRIVKQLGNLDLRFYYNYMALTISTNLKKGNIATSQ